MGQISDDLYLGNAPTLFVGTDSVGNPGGRGVGPMGRTYAFDVVPAAAATANIAASQALLAAGSVVLTAGAGVTQTTFAGQTVFQLDTPRALSITSSANISAVTITITGYCRYGQLMTEARVGPNTTTINFQKAFYRILSITTSAAVTNISVGTSNILGFPYAVTDRGYITHVGWDNTLADNAATVVPAVTTTASATTGDVRGTILPAGSAPDGVRRLVVAIILPAIASGPNATRIGALGVPQA